MTAVASARTGSDTPDVLELYRWAVQDPETHAELLRIVHERMSPPRATVTWARRRAARILGEGANDIVFVERDVEHVRKEDAPVADVIAVLNFSILHFLERDALTAYLARARDALAPGGVLVVNLFGGSEAVRPHVERHHVAPKPRLAGDVPVAPFDYLWEVRAGGAASERIDCAIHFDMRGRSVIRDAFGYAWRLWSPRDVLAACADAGFSRAQLWRHTYDASRGARGVFLGSVPVDAVDVLPRWTAYVVAQR